VAEQKQSDKFKRRENYNFWWGDEFSCFWFFFFISNKFI
jgi:hypothetical protein